MYLSFETERSKDLPERIWIYLFYFNKIRYCVI
jgi:hypothetical protein